jgi:hypothetical protein
MNFDHPLVAGALRYGVMPIRRVLAGSVRWTPEIQSAWGIDQSYEFHIAINDAKIDDEFAQEIAQQSGVDVDEVYGSFHAIDDRGAPFWGLTINIPTEYFEDLRDAIGAFGMAHAEIGIDLTLGNFVRQQPWSRYALIDGKPLIELKSGAVA